MNKTANVSNIKLTEKCTKTVKIQVIHNIKKMHVIREKNVSIGFIALLLQANTKYTQWGSYRKDCACTKNLKC